MARKKKPSKKVPNRSSRSLKAIQPNAAGIDLGSNEHWVAGPLANDDKPNVQCFGTTTPELYRLADWLHEQDVKTVAMESTGVYWIPLFCSRFSIAAALRWRWPMPGKSATCRVARPTSSTAGGFNCCTPAGCCAVPFGLRTTFAA